MVSLVYNCLDCSRSSKAFLVSGRANTK
jgi:hypothetical protein